MEEAGRLLAELDLRITTRALICKILLPADIISYGMAKQDNCRAPARKHGSPMPCLWH
jgi:hypothetical protein